MMLRRQICERAVFDHSADDPRFLVYRYQQRLRADLLDKAAREEQYGNLLKTVGNMVIAALAELGRAIINPQPAPQPAAPARHLRLVPTTQVSF